MKRRVRRFTYETVFVAAWLLGIMFVLTTGCDDMEIMTRPVVDRVADDGQKPTQEPVVMSEVKELEEEPATVTQGTPFVQEVGFYRDQEQTESMSDAVALGETIHIKIVFSEEMKLVVADDEAARPILYYKVGGNLTQFRIVPGIAKGEDFVSGDARQVKTQAVYYGKYTVKASDIGKKFTVAVGKFSVDKQGNAMDEFYTHGETLQIGQTLPSPGTLTLVPARDSGVRGDNITNHTTIIVAGKIVKKPPQGTKVQLYNDGVAIPNAIDTTIDQKNRWAISAALSEGIHTLTARSEKGSDMSAETEPLTIMVDTTAPTAEATAYLEDNTLIAAVSGEGVTNYRYAVVMGECDETTVFSDATDKRIMVNESISAFPAGTLSFCVIGEDAAGNRQTAPTVVHTEKIVPEIQPRAIEGTPAQNLQDFTGWVYIPVPSPGVFFRSHTTPVADATVTIIAGPRVGEIAGTDPNGQYVFPNIEANELHLLVQKEGFEPKEVIVHRYHPTTLSNGVTTNFHEDPQKIPGTILIGHAWPDEVRFILRGTLVVNDLLYIDGGIPSTGDAGGFYDSGVAVVYAEHVARFHGTPGVLGTIAHEIAHAHQHALVSISGNGDIWEWKNTPEGRAFAEARRKDWEEFGKADYDTIPGYDTLDENAAETCAHYWSVNRWGGRTAYGRLEISSPNRFRWAKQWLK